MMDFKERLRELVDKFCGRSMPDYLVTCVPCTLKQAKNLLILLDAVDEVIKDTGYGYGCRETYLVSLGMMNRLNEARNELGGGGGE